MPIPSASSTVAEKARAAEEARILSTIYAFLAMTVRYPDPASFGDQYLDTLEMLAASMGESDSLDAFRRWRKQPIDLLDDLRTEYTRLFITSAPRTTLPPYASVYVDGDGTLQGRTTERTRDFYRERGFDLADETEPADHIAHELDFLSALTGEARFEDEHLFLETLFRPWFVRFLERSTHTVRHPFFLVSFQLIDFFTKEEQ